MSGDKPLTGVRKRQQIADTNKQILIWAGIASSLVVICVVVAINFIQDIAYQVKVNSELSNTASNLSNSVNNIPTLIKNVGNLSTNQSLNLQNVNSYTDSNGNNQIIPAQQVVLYAMPTSNDATSLAVSLQNLLSSAGVSVTQISMQADASATQAPAPAPASTTAATGAATGGTASGPNLEESNSPKAQPTKFTVVISGNPNSGVVQKALKTLENMTRVIKVNLITTQAGTTTIQATAYFTPRVDYKTGTEEVKP